MESTKKHCGAVAVSWHRQEHTKTALKMFIKADVKTNIHYVLGNNTIEEAITQLKYASNSTDCMVCQPFPKGINAVIFLLHKPVGLGQSNNVLKIDDPRVKEFFKLIDNGNFPFKVGFDSCSCSGIVNNTHNISRDSLDYCEGARYSAYISSNMIMVPCSFDQDHKWGVDISKDGSTIEGAWNSTEFWDFRDILSKSCNKCEDRLACMGGCPIVNSITLCNREGRDFYIKD